MGINFSLLLQQKTTRLKKLDYLPLISLTVILFFLPFGASSGSRDTLAIVFVSIILEAIPFMLLGSLIGGFIEVFISRERMTALLPDKGWLAVCLAAAAGMLFPVCECAVVPVVRRLLGKGLPVSAAIAYLLGGPIVNPIVATSTAMAYAFDWRIVILRLAFGYGLAVLIGTLMGRFFTDAAALESQYLTSANNTQPSGCDHRVLPLTNLTSSSQAAQPFPFATHSMEATTQCDCGCSHAAGTGWMDRVGAAFNHAMHDFLAVGHYLVIGAFIAALAQTYIDRSGFLSLGGAPLLSIVLMMILAVLLNLCSEADAFIAASFRGLMPVSAQLAFLLIGPMFDLKLLLMYQGLFKRKAIIALASLVFVLVLTVAVVLEKLPGITP